MMERKDKIKAIKEFIQTGAVSLPVLHGLPEGIVLIPSANGTYLEHGTGNVWKESDINPAMCRGKIIYIKDEEDLVMCVTLCI
jgi:hypothetical protein